MVTFFAPPHWEFLTVEPWEEQELRCLQVEPSPIEKWNSKSASNSVMTSMVLTEKDSISVSEPQPNEGELSFE